MKQHASLRRLSSESLGEFRALHHHFRADDTVVRRRCGSLRESSALCALHCI